MFMSKIRYAIIGSGWRSLYYLRIAKALPQQFEVTGMLVRSQEKVDAFSKEYNIFVTMSKEELFGTKPDFIVTAINRSDNAGLCVELMKEGVPVLAETPPADSLEELVEIWEEKKRRNGKLLIAEQYFLYPTYEAGLQIARQGYLGEIQNVTLSALHEYHGMSMIRLFLNAGLSNVKITAKKYTWPVVVTQNRAGVLQRGGKAVWDRVRAELEFENNTIGFYDFSDVQYHSYVRDRHLQVQGTRGEMDDDMVYYLSKQDDPLIEKLIPVNDGIRPGIESIAFGGKAIYKNPFPTNVLPEDETAIARLLVGMKEYIETGKEIYPLSYAMQDAYFAILLKEAATTGKAVVSERQVWCDV